MLKNRAVTVWGSKRNISLTGKPYHLMLNFWLTLHNCREGGASSSIERWAAYLLDREQTSKVTEVEQSYLII
jgi:hypothetical protein